MDQEKIGKFLQAVRRERGYTQSVLAEKLNVSDKTVSKWETGKGLPEVGLMLPLCEILHITVNELLSGERLDEENYSEKAEENMMNLMREKEAAKKKIVLCVVVGASTLLPAVTLALLSGLLDMPVWTRILLIGIAVAVMTAGIGVCCVLEREAGVYECPDCGARFVPSMRDYVFGAHTLTKRRLKCPVCGKKRFCRKKF